MAELLEPNIPGNLNNFLNMLKDDVNMDGGESQNQTISTINNILFIQAQQHMHIALGAVSIALAMWVILRIWYDSWRASKLQANLRSRCGFFMTLHPAESFPLALAFTSLFQALTFVIIQSLALNTDFIPRCVVTSQIIFPAIFSLSYMHLVFGFEMAIRSLQKVPFQPRDKWAYMACILGFVILLIGTWIPTRIMPEEKMTCFGDIIWQPFRNVKTGAGISAGLIFAFLTMAAIIGLQLYNTRNVDPNERIAGSRMVYYLTASAILQVFVLPFFIQGVTMKFDKQHSSSLVAEFILFTSGSFLALLHLILRANASLTAIKAKSTPWHKQRQFRFFGPSDLELITISAPIDLIYESYQQDEKLQEACAPKMISLQMSSTPPTLPKLTFATKAAVEPLTPQCPRAVEHLPLQNLPSVPPKAFSSSSPSSTHKRNNSDYSVFPAEIADEIHLPATTYKLQTPSAPVQCQAMPEVRSTPVAPMVITTSNTSHNGGDLLQPQRLRNESFLLRRSSVDSSATVQIGIRLSNATAALVSNSLQSVDDPLVPGSSIQRPLSVKFHQSDHSLQELRHSSLPREESVKPNPTNNDSWSKDSQKPEHLQLDATQLGDAIILKPELAAPPSRIHRSHELPAVPPKSDDTPAGFF